MRTEFLNRLIRKRLNNEIIKEDTPPIVKFLEKVGKNEINHYYYLPEAAYKNSQSRSDGLIVDLQEIDSLSLSDASRIEMTMDLLRSILVNH